MLKKAVLIGILVLAEICGGCKLSSRQTRPNPSPVPKQLRSAPRISKRDIRDRLTKIEVNVKRNNWGLANKEVNRLGSEMINHYPISGKGRSLMKMGKFDGDYAKLKVSVQAHRKRAALNELARMRRNLGRIS
jgi:hypothetical protein